MEFVSKESMKRLVKDVKHIIQNPLTDNGIYYCHDDTDMLKGYALIIGPEGTPYFSGNYFFEFHYPTDYPHKPPRVVYSTNGENIRFNPNLYTNGKVCVSILNTWSGDQWTSCNTISTVLLTLCTLLCEKPLLNEPGVTSSHTEFDVYNRIIEYANIRIAICGIIMKNDNYYKSFFNLFYPYVKERFLKNYDQLIIFIKKMDLKVELVTMNFYNMKVKIDYADILEKLDECKKYLENSKSL